jgi:hypothetical protein
MKTGGSSIRESLVKYFGEENVLIDRSYRIDRLKTKGIIKLHKSLLVYPSGYKNYKVIFGHFNFRKYNHLGRPTITFLRNPIERVRSHYSTGEKKDYISFEKYCFETSNLIRNMTGGNLSRFFFVGITEYFDKSISILNNLLDIKLTSEKVNVNINKIELDEKKIEVIKKYNKDDIRLYEEAVKKFKEYK